MPDPNKDETLPAKFEDWTPPWGDKTEDFDADRAARRIFGLLQDKHKAQSDKAAATTAKTEAEKQRDTVQVELDGIKRKDESETDRLKRENEKLKADAENAGKTSVETLKLRVALKKGLDEVQAARLIGTTEEELLADADALVASFGGSGKEGDGGGDGDGKGPRRTPKRTNNPLTQDSLDPDPSDGPAAQVVDEFIPRTSF